ncbi:MAG: VOC family protein [Pseudomonadota bacterium]|nr:VOC family protein [Pseudomonadota bacterium]
MIDHSGVSVADVARSKAFYRAALAPLGYTMLMEFEQFAGFGVAPKPDFWVGQGKPNVPPIHVAFRAESRTQVDEFYRAAIAAGGNDNGPPGPRPQYHPNYYGAFVLDPDGHNIEAVCHTAEYTPE